MQKGDEDVVCLRAKERSNTESREERAELRAAHREYMPGGTGYYEAKAHFEECHHFSRILRFVCLKTRKFFWPRRGGRSQDRELGW